MDTPVLADQQKITSAQYGHWMPPRGTAKRNKQTRQMAKRNQSNPYYRHALIMKIWLLNGTLKVSTALGQIKQENNGHEGALDYPKISRSGCSLFSYPGFPFLSVVSYLTAGDTVSVLNVGRQGWNVKTEYNVVIFIFFFLNKIEKNTQ